MALENVLSDELSVKLERLAEKLGVRIESLAVRAIKVFVDSYKDDEDVAEIARIQFTMPFRVP